MHVQFVAAASQMLQLSLLLLLLLSVLLLSLLLSLLLVPFLTSIIITIITTIIHIIIIITILSTLSITIMFIINQACKCEVHFLDGKHLEKSSCCGFDSHPTELGLPLQLQAFSWAVLSNYY
jgi:hypothetical protein